MLNPTENALDEATVIMVKQLYYLRTREAVTEQITRPLNIDVAAGYDWRIGLQVSYHLA